MGKSAARVTKPIPPLRDGDRMDADEFIRRYAADKTVARAELIQGVVYVNARTDPDDPPGGEMPPISSAGHGVPHIRIGMWLAVYEAHTPGVEASNPTTVQATEEDRPEPDALLRILPECGGATTRDKNDYLVGAPELIVEVSRASAGHDLGPRRRAYLKSGVKEYIVWRTEDALVEWFVLRRKQYELLTPDANGVLRSSTFPGLRLDVPALLAGELATVLKTLQNGTASPEHAAFVAKLRKAAGKPRKR
jgi:Uma2 family endonuclease